MEQDKNKELTVFWVQSQPVVATFIRSLVSNFQDADDILQKVAVITVEKFDEFDRNYPFSAWCIGIAKNLIMKYYAGNDDKRKILSLEAIEKVVEVYEQDAASIQVQAETTKQALKKCLSLLQGRMKKIIEMRYLEELSLARIAQLSSLTQNNVGVVLHRSRLALKKCVERVLRGDYEGFQGGYYE